MQILHAVRKEDLPSPRTTSRGLGALGVGNGRWEPIAVLFIDPLFRLLSVCELMVSDQISVSSKL